MGAVQQVTQGGPKTFAPVEAILGGQLVEARTGGIGVAAAGTVRGLGVALTDAQAASAVQTEPTIVNGRPVLNAAILPTTVAVAYGGTEVPVKYSAAAVFGDKLIAAALGTVVPAGATPDARTIVGTCSAPAGVASGAVGLMRTV